jgi:hypothetical protein
VLAPMPRLGSGASALLVFGAIHHWLLDLRAGTVVRRSNFTGDASSNPYSMGALEGGAVLIRDRRNTLYRLDGGEGDMPLPAPRVARAHLPIAAVVHRGGLVVLTEPAPLRMIPAIRTGARLTASRF